MYRVEPPRVSGHRIRTLVLVTSWLLATPMAASAQDPPQPPPPAVRLSVDVVPVDVSVLDNGRPVTGLTTSDFSVSVDGSPRRLVSVQYVSALREAETTTSASRLAFSSNTNSGGRLIMLAVDRGNIGPGRGRQAMEAAIRFISKLSPADRVGLVSFPGAGPVIDFTTNHALVQSALPTLTGLTDTFPSSYRIGTSEAMAIVQGDRSVLNTVTQRECGGLTNNEERDLCIRQVVSESQGIFSDHVERARNALSTLRSLVERLSETPTPKTIVYISEGLVLERPSDANVLAPVTARGQVAIYALQLEVLASEASVARAPVSPGRDKALASEGLGMIAGVTRGAVINVVGNGDGAFTRLSQELSGYYLLGFEPASVDRDGKLHKINVTVPARSGIEIRSRNQFSIAPSAVKTDDDALQETIRSPALATDIGLKLATYTMRDPESDKLRILMAAEIDRSGHPDGKLALAYSLVDSRGRLIDSQIDRQIKAPVSPDTSIQKYTGFILSNADGPHTLKVAVVDERGRRGSVEHSFRATLTAAGEVRATDLLIADERGGTGSASPMVGAEFTSGMVNSYIELYSDAPDVLKNTTVMFEVAADEQSRALDGAAGRVQKGATESVNRRSLEGAVPVSLLPPGEYIVRAIISTDGKRVGQVTRPIRVGRTIVAARTKPSGTGTRLMAATTVTVSSRSDRFDRGAVLTPQVLDFFIDRLDVGARGEANAAPVVEYAKAGRFDDAVKALSIGNTSMPGAFLSGLRLYAKGEFDPAAVQFREALRLDSEFFPAAFYLGSCYAAGERDDQAVGAWQLALVTETEAPFLYTLIGDALLRLKEPDQALEILNQAADKWPDNDQVQVRIGAALAMSGKRAEALLKLEPYLEKHPDDQDRHLFGLRVLYEARAAGKPIRSTNEDKALFARWAAAYAKANGPQQALVAQWQKTIGK